MNGEASIPGPRRPLDSVQKDTLTFDATLSYRVTLSRSELAATKRRMVQVAIEAGEESANETWYSDQEAVVWNINEWIASGNHCGHVDAKDSTVWTVK